MPPGRRKSLETVPDQLRSQQSHGYKCTFKTLGATWIGNNYYSKFLFQNSLPSVGQIPTPFPCKVARWNPWTLTTLFSGLNFIVCIRMVEWFWRSECLQSASRNLQNSLPLIDWWFLLKVFVTCQNQVCFAWCKSHWNQYVKILTTMIIIHCLLPWHIVYYICFWGLAQHKCHNITIKFLHIMICENIAKFCLISIKQEAIKCSAGMIFFKCVKY